MSGSNFDEETAHAPSPPKTQAMSGERDDPRPPSQQRVRPKLVVRRLWLGGVGVSVVSALVVLVGVLLFGGVFNIPVPAGVNGTRPESAAVIAYVSLAALVGLAVTAALHAMLLLLPRPLQFVRWVCALVIAVAVLVPFTIGMPSGSQVATAGINFVAGICMMAMLNSVSASSVLVAGPSDPKDDPPTDH